ncbi:MAG TPA: hypothetical protein VHM26_18015 [Chitinophagaceae bacterium]|jgi:hypothetical protein|nr:hypothetical protein [Chitinophagaceae bacterium]
MKKIFLFIAVLATVFTACNNNNKQKPGDTDTTAKKPVDTIVAEPTKPVNEDSALLALSADILKAIKDTNYSKFIAHIHPTQGVRLSPYGYIDTSENRIVQANELLNLLHSNKKIVWGSFDGTGDPINITAAAYFKRFVYNVDYLNAPDKAANRIIGGGNSPSNIEKLYPGAPYTEFHFKGFEAKYEGMDWASLRLVFKKENNTFWLIAIVHDEWTI